MPWGLAQVCVGPSVVGSAPPPRGEVRVRTCHAREGAFEHLHMYMCFFWRAEAR